MQAILKKRTRRFGLDVIRLVDSLPRSWPAEVVGKQLLRSALSVGANYRAACRAKSRADFVNKMAIVEEEADESQHWMEVLAEAGIVSAPATTHLQKEAGELVAIAVASIRTARENKAGESRGNPQSTIRNPQSKSVL